MSAVSQYDNIIRQFDIKLLHSNMAGFDPLIIIFKIKIDFKQNNL